MRTALLSVVVALVSSLFVSCGQKEPDMASLKKTVDDFNTASKEAMMSGNVDKVLSYYDDNAMEMPPNMGLIRGKDAIKAFWNQMDKSGVKMTAVSFTVEDIQAGGTIAYEIGTYDMTMSAGKSGEMKDNGKYITLWKEQTDGTWKVVAETWNSDKALPAVEKSRSSKSDSKHKVTAKKPASKKSAMSKKSGTKKKATAKKAPAKKSAKKSTTKKK